MSSITITIPELPNAALKSAFRGGWWLVRKAKVHDTEMAYMYGLAAKDGQHFLPMTPVEATVTFIFKEHRKRDLDNYGARLKGFWDGITKARIIPDDSSDHLTSIKIRFEVDKKRAPMTIITLSEVEDEI